MTHEEHGGSEPFYIRQSAEPDIDLKEWVRSAASEARDLGAKFSRATLSDDGKMVLFEAWRERPQSQGAPRWMLRGAAT